MFFILIKGLPEDYLTKDFNDDDLPSAIDNLCKKYDGRCDLLASCLHCNFIFVPGELEKT